MAADKGNREDVGKNDRNEQLEIGVTSQSMKYYSVIMKVMKMIKVEKIEIQCNGILISDKRRIEEQTADTYSNMDRL